MATKEAKKTEKKTVTFDYDEADIKKAADLINQNGFITKLDFPKMENPDWSFGFEKKIDDYLLDQPGSHYMYFEKFDFLGGTIENIIFDMDKVKTRMDALHTLGDTLGLTVF
ncbi:hypothetical protein LOSG293_300180 [Secundilactobacillus oryzae JCM 18671]|uniref:Uncharacterized protein n=1 Tax=Secundilactobacillus oryzae JCM 18671 TaxID=1291743 RepID=A0A081BK79_9LACO|nr:hypothetical protein [Secundilactobacillus oryzae]GAK48447.1 hypothetical protein LOSG293_300180 [Secundilactobacillus oryzae JCM 18671]